MRVESPRSARGFSPARGHSPRAFSRADGFAVKTRGFTLLEVLIAILLLALALTALVRLAGLEARASAHLRDATLAQWVAANALAETRLRTAFPGIGRSDGEATLGGQRWRWQLDVNATDEASIRRLDVQVFVAGDDVREDAASVASLSGFAVQR